MSIRISTREKAHLGTVVRNFWFSVFLFGLLLTTIGCGGYGSGSGGGGGGGSQFPPTIASLNPTSGPVNTSVTITGNYFGPTQGTSTVKFNGLTATPTSWSATSIVAPVPTGATTGNVVVTVGGTASNGVSFIVTTSSTKFPIKVSANGRYFTDASGTPWLMVADAMHRAINNLPVSGYQGYITDRQGHGFNAIDFFAACTNTSTCPASGAAFDGTLPFTSGSSPSNYDFATPNNAYWSEVDTFIQEANTANMVVLLRPLPWGNGWAVAFQNNGVTKAFNLGAYLGNRYKGFNIIWGLGQDFDGGSLPSSSNMSLMAQFMAGILSADPNHLMTCQLNYSRSYSQQGNSINSTYATDLNNSFVYTYYETYDYVLASYNASPTMPVFLGEANYETGNNTGALSSPADAFITRMEMWWTATSGGTGSVFGNTQVEHVTSSYSSNLDTTATAQVQYLLKLLSTLAWWTLSPDQSHRVVTAGYGSYNGGNENLYNATYATTAWDGGTLSLTYTPVSTTLSVNMANFSKTMTAKWYDPTTGSSTALGSFTNSGMQNFATPSTAHADGTHDWILVLD